MGRKITENLYDRAHELRQKGMPYKQIGEVLGCSKFYAYKLLKSRLKPDDPGKIRTLRITGGWSFEKIAEEIRMDTGNYTIDAAYIEDCCRKMGIS